MAQTKKFNVIATEPTPNSSAFKFVVDSVIIKDGSRAFNNAEEAESDPFAKEIFDFGIVDFLYIKDRFVSITLLSPDEWEDMFDPFIQTIEEHLVPYEDGGNGEAEKSILDDVDLEKFMDYDDETKREIIDAFMDEGVRPALAQDGGGILVKDVEGDVVFIQYQGACGSCSKSQSSTLSAMQNILQRSVHPDLRVVVRGFDDL
ncbi:putative Nitrogen-fixing NifU-like [Nitrospina gracilis 3/211]|uniref:Putative Nitrogen-fixing NifU-like n=1 Tax=Nitrospina gracilis (strain 3/211) TaxID=1266370 RepID=M1YZC0_NITG3|nr:MULTISPECIES: NifU family protein [Nitrospina]MCF8723740.1 Fe-S cluster biogenesis protein NfuA [Nitrospina sp. Nb-3]CCQ90840.1 putative Nitrogen-fixing NifU-like [Nitrospina gracilis 3/211]